MEHSAEVAKYLIDWELSSPTEIAMSQTNCIYKVIYNNTQAVLKILTPLGKKFEATSSRTLQCFGGKGAVRLLEFDEWALLLEYIDGDNLATLVRTGYDLRAAQVICDIIDQLHQYSGPVPSEVYDLRRQFQSLFLRAKIETSDSIYFKTAKVAEHLVATEKNQRLLHGDIHHANILQSSGRGWLAIDPQSIYGERTYDVANSFFNPDDTPEIIEIPNRIEALAEVFAERLQTDRKRVLQFAYAHGGLSSSWQLDAGENPQRRLRITNLIGELL